MLQSALVLVAAGGVVAQTYPDQLDILRGADTTPQIELVLDTSGSMTNAGNLVTSTCEWYYRQYVGATPPAGNADDQARPSEGCVDRMHRRRRRSDRQLG